MLQRIENHCRVHHKLNELGMHQLADPEFVPKEHAVRFQKDDRQQCSITMQAPVESLRFTMWFAILK
jgi:hypothetical protein